MYFQSSLLTRSLKQFLTGCQKDAGLSVCQKNNQLTSILVRQLFKRSFADISGSGRKKVLTVAVLGMPNSGKSTLVNHFVGTRVSAVTHVAHTTRRAANGVVNVDDTQIVFTDTPGVISYEEGRRLNMDKMQVRAPGRVCASVDLLAVMVDVSRRSTREHVDGNILNILNEYSSLPSVLIMNKVDLVRQKVNLLNYASMLTIDREKDEWGYKSFGGWSKFEEVFMVSAHTGDGLSDLLDFFLRRAYTSDWLYSANIHTDTSIEEQIAEVFREKLLLLFKHEIPWKMKQVMMGFQVLFFS